MPRLHILRKGEGSIAGYEMIETENETNSHEVADLEANKQL